MSQGQRIKRIKRIKRCRDGYSCKFRLECNFGHTKEEMSFFIGKARRKQDAWKTTPCNIQRCNKKAEDCNFRHPEDNLRFIDPSPKKKFKGDLRQKLKYSAPKKSKSSASKSMSDEMDNMRKFMTDTVITNAKNEAAIARQKEETLKLKEENEKLLAALEEAKNATSRLQSLRRSTK